MTGLARSRWHCLAALRACLALVVCLACMVATRAARAESGPAELLAGEAARSAHPPDLALARAHFESAARDTDDRAAAEALYFLAEMDDVAFDFKSALAHYEASVARLPSSRYAPRASRRANDLRMHAEGGFAPLVRLETVRRSPALANDAATIDALVQDAAGFPPGRVRVEARALAAEAYGGRLHRKGDAVPLLRLVADDPSADVLGARVAASELLAAYLAGKDYASALAVTERYAKLLPPAARRDVLRLERRRTLQFAAWGDLGLLTLFALVALVRPGRGRVLRAVWRLAPMALAFATLASGVGGYLASSYEQSSPYPFAAMLPAMFVIILLARAGSAGGPDGAPTRALRALVAFAGVLGAAFLMLDRMDPAYLSGFGL